jgi:hypothetical protein
MRKYNGTCTGTIVMLSFAVALVSGWVAPRPQLQASGDTRAAGVMPCEEDCIPSIYNGVLHCKPGGEWKCSYSDQ